MLSRLMETMNKTWANRTGWDDLWVALAIVAGMAILGLLMWVVVRLWRWIFGSPKAPMSTAYPGQSQSKIRAKFATIPAGYTAANGATYLCACWKLHPDDYWRINNRERVGQSARIRCIKCGFTLNRDMPLERKAAPTPNNLQSFGDGPYQNNTHN